MILYVCRHAVSERRASFCDTRRRVLLEVETVFLVLLAAVLGLLSPGTA